MVFALEWLQKVGGTSLIDVVQKAANVCLHRIRRLKTVISLPSRTDFDRVFKDTDSKCSSRALLILARRSPSVVSRVGFITSKKKIRRAVDRNRFKRIIREFLRRHPPPIALDLVIMAKQTPPWLHNANSNEEIFKAMSKLYGKLIK